MSNKCSVAELMFLFRTGWSHFIKRLSLVSSKHFLFPCAKMVNSSKEGLLSHRKTCVLFRQFKITSKSHCLCNFYLSTRLPVIFQKNQQNAIRLCCIAGSFGFVIFIQTSINFLDLEIMKIKEWGVFKGCRKEIVTWDRLIGFCSD